MSLARVFPLGTHLSRSVQGVQARFKRRAWGLGASVTLRSRWSLYTPRVMPRIPFRLSRPYLRASWRLIDAFSLAPSPRSRLVWFFVLTPALFVLLGSSPPPADELVRGLEVYSANYCGVCHTLSAAHTLGQFGPSHDGLRATIEARFKDGSYGGKATDVAAYLRESILEPEAYLDPAFAGSRYRMPAFTDLSSEDLEALVGLLEQP